MIVKTNFFTVGIFILSLSLLAIFMLTRDFVFSGIPSRAFQDDYLFLEDYKESIKNKKELHFKIDKYQKENFLYKNIFGYFEIPANWDWYIVPYKWPSRLFLKAPIFLMADSFLFPLVWRLSWILIGLSFFILAIREFNIIRRILITFSLILFAPILVFDPEYIFFFLCIVTLFFFLRTQYLYYLLFYFLFWLYASYSRMEFFYFFSIFNAYLFFYFIIHKRYKYLSYIVFVSVIFLLGFWLSNFQYYWGYFKTGYELYRDWDVWAASSVSEGGQLSIIEVLLKKPFQILFPSGFSLKITFDVFGYIIFSYIWFGFFIFLFGNLRRPSLAFSQSRYFKYFILIFIVYWFFYYGSNPYFFRPDNDPTHSSYTRYLWVFILLLWLVFYSWMNVIPNKIPKILFFWIVIFYIVIWPNFFGMKHDSLNPFQYLSKIEKNIPPWSVILPVHATMFTFWGYHVLHPSGKDYLEHQVYIKIWRISRGTSSFLDNVWYYIFDTNTPVYIIWDWWFAHQKILDFYKTNNSLKLEVINKNYAVITNPHNQKRYTYRWSEGD